MKLLTSTLVLALTLPSFADIFIMKDGSRIKADVIERTPEEYVLDVYVTKSIKEQKTIKRADIEKIERVSQADEDFKELTDLTPAPPFLSLEDYDARLKKLEAFTTKHKISTATTKAKEMVKELESERGVIAAGGIKGPDGLLTAEERLGDAVNIDSQQLAAEFEALVEERAYLPALRKFEKLEGNFPGSAAHRKALPLFKKLLGSYRLLINRELSNFGSMQMKRKESFERLTEADQARAMTAEKARMKQVEKIRMREQEEEMVWPLVDLLDEQSLAQTSERLERRINGLPKIEEQLTSMPDTGALYQEAWKAATAKDRAKLEPILGQLDAAGIAEDTVNLLVDRFDPTLNAPSEEMMDEKKMMDEESAKSEENADTDPTPDPATAE